MDLKNLEIIICKYANSKKTAIDVLLRDKESKETFPYGYHINSNDSAPITLWLNDLWKKGKLVPIEYDGIHEKEELARNVRYERNLILSHTDYLIMPDYPISKKNKDEVIEYRQLLRDITKQNGFPENIVWPEEPIFICEKIKNN